MRHIYLCISSTQPNVSFVRNGISELFRCWEGKRHQLKESEVLLCRSFMEAGHSSIHLSQLAPVRQWLVSQPPNHPRMEWN